jgi:hypothetical protein
MDQVKDSKYRNVAATLAEMERTSTKSKVRGEHAYTTTPLEQLKLNLARDIVAIAESPLSQPTRNENLPIFSGPVVEALRDLHLIIDSGPGTPEDVEAQFHVAMKLETGWHPKPRQGTRSAFPNNKEEIKGGY